MTDANAQFMDLALQLQRQQRDSVSPEEARKTAVLAALRSLGSLSAQTSELTYEGTRFVLPASYRGNVKGAAEYLVSYERSQQKTYNYSQTFNYRPWDGANAFQQTLVQLFGSAGIGKDTQTMFGTNPPRLVSIDVGVNEKIQVPWGEVSLPQLEATFVLDSDHNREYGLVFTLHVEAPRKYQQEIAAFFDAVADYLRTNSIYKGKAINGAQHPGFIKLGLDPSTVVYSEEVFTQLEANLWSLFRHTDTMRDLGIPLKRAVLLEGPYGTGKTLAGKLTAQEAVENGWTYIAVRPGQDNFENAMKTAAIYAPAVVWFEDIDVVASGGSQQEISQLLDTLDGLTNKGTEVVAAFTTNFVEKLQKGVLRPGRLDAIIHIGPLDQEGVEKLTRNLVKPELLGDVDYAKVFKAMHGFFPAFAVEAIHAAVRYSLSRNNGVPGRIETDDLVNSALGLRRQLDLMNGAGEGANVPTLDSVLTEKLSATLNQVQLVKDNRGNSGLYVDEDRELDLENVEDQLA